MCGKKIPQSKEKNMAMFWTGGTWLLVPLVLLAILIPLHEQSGPVLVEGKPGKGVYLPGDMILGGLFPVHEKSKSQEMRCGAKTYNRGIQRLEAMLYAVDNINKDPTLLKDIKLGVNILDTCGRDTYALNQSLEFIRSSLNTFDVSQYECSNGGGTPRLKFNSTGPILGVIGGSYSSVSIQVANLLRLFRIPQISPASTAKALSDKSRFEMFARTVPPDTFQAIALVDIVKKFNWTYVSTIASEGSYGESGIDVFQREAEKRNICIAIAEKVPSNANEAKFMEVVGNLLKKPNAKAVVLFTRAEDARGILEAAKRLLGRSYSSSSSGQKFYWLASDGWGKQGQVVKGIEDFAVGAITVELESKRIAGFDDYMNILTPEDNERNFWFRDYWEDVFDCYVEQSSSGSNRNRRRSIPWYDHRRGREITNLCDPKLRLSHLPSFEQDSKVQFVIDAVYAFAYALDALKQDICPHWKGICPAMASYDGGDFYKHYLLKVDFTDVANSTVQFDANGDGIARYTIFNYQKNPIDGSTDYKVIGKWHSELMMNAGDVKWSSSSPTDAITTTTTTTSFPSISSTTDNSLMELQNTIPTSVCSFPCKTGEIMIMNTGDTCCWICQKCMDFEFMLDKFTCQDCGNGRWPHPNKTKCYDLEMKYMRWDTVFAIVPVCIACLGTVLTVATIVIFVKFADTPLVRASGRELSYVILAGLLLCYINTFILLAKPGIVVCALQRFSVGMGFSIVYGALLTKTNRISRIFHSASQSARRPSYISPRSQLIITAVLVSVQFLATLLWIVAAFPGAQRVYPMRSEVILKCNVNDSSFLISQVYNMVLITVCTYYAILTRKVPENFNEAKFIGFTMYTTCVIWLAFIPIYFGTGNSFEIQITTLCISISLSAYVTLVCLFSPKLYIIVFQPEKNVRKLTMNSFGAKKTTTSLVSTAATAALAANSMGGPIGNSNATAAAAAAANAALAADTPSTNVTAINTKAQVMNTDRNCSQPTPSARTQPAIPPRKNSKELEIGDLLMTIWSNKNRP